MIKFFRHIRRSLINQNQMGKYLKYAVGEIILVVLGILIALQINNWNENRLQRNEEKVILNNLKEDYKNVIEEFQALNKIRQGIIEVSNKITVIDPNKIDEYPTTYLDSLFSKTLYSPTFNNKAGSLNVLLTSGKIDLISNQTLKNKLIAWPGDVADMTEDEINNDQLYQGPYLEILSNYLSWNNLVKEFTLAGVRFKGFTLNNIPHNQIVTSDYYELLKNKSFLNMLNRRATYCSFSNYESEALIKKAQDIIDSINKELMN